MPKPTLNLTARECIARRAYPTKIEAINAEQKRAERCRMCGWWHGVVTDSAALRRNTQAAMS